MIRNSVFDICNIWKYNTRCKIIILVISPSSSFYMLITTIYWSVKLSLWAEMPFNRITVCGLHYTWTLHNIRSHFFQPPVWPNLTTPPAQVVSVLSELTWRLRRSGEYGSVSGSPWFCPWGWAGNEVGHTVSETINCFLIKSVLQAFSVQGSDLRGGDGGCIWSLSWCLTPLKAKKTWRNSALYWLKGRTAPALWSLLKVKLNYRWTFCSSLVITKSEI